MPRSLLQWPIRVWIRETSGPLIDRGFGLVYDVQRDITWLQDANYARTAGRSPDGQMTWQRAMAWAASLNYYGITGWRLPSALNRDGSGPCIGADCRDSEFAHLVHGPWTTHPGQVAFRNFDPHSIYWTSTEASPTEAHGFYFYTLRQGTLPKDPFAEEGFDPVRLYGPVLAWLVHDGDVVDQLSLWRRFVALTRVSVSLGGVS